MYLVFMNDALFAYSYDSIATLALMKVVGKKLNLTCKQCDSSIIPASWGLMDKNHIDNLVNWYKERDYDYYLWKKIAFNRNFLLKGQVSFDFMRDLHNAILSFQISVRRANARRNKYHFSPADFNL